MYFIRLALEILLYLLILRVFVDFLQPLENTSFGRAMLKITNPILAPVQRILPKISFEETTIDVSALVIVLLLHLIIGFI